MFGAAMADTDTHVQIRPVVPDDRSGTRGFAWRPRPVDDDDRYRGRRRRPGRFAVRDIVAMVATTVAGCSLLVLGVWLVRPAPHAHPPGPVARSADPTETEPVDILPPDQLPPSPSAGASQRPSTTPTARATTGAPVAAPPPAQPPPAPPPPPPGPTSPAPDQGTTYQAESSANTRTGAVSPRTISGTSTVVMHNIGDSTANTLTFNGVTVPTAGTYTLTIGYVAGSGPRSAVLVVNGGPGRTFDFAATANWSTVATKEITVDLKAGTNTLKFGNPNDFTPHLDYVVVRSPL